MNRLVPGMPTICHECGHRADLPRIRCDCPRCKRALPEPAKPKTPLPDDGTPEAAGRIQQAYRDQWWAAMRVARGVLLPSAPLYHEALNQAEEYGRLAAQWSDEHVRRLRVWIADVQSRLREGVNAG